ncbi:serine/threonine protein kinase [Streptomyces sp. NPDC048337]|uniref:serine/threonine protein kinase n=1 Tax=Streptomyces sp. NPDC048337 TaxID=3365535 RepID=UPI00371D9F13
MERLRHDDPSQIGPYATLARLDAESAGRTVPERRYLARGGDGERTVLLCVPPVGADPSRWAIEAEGARRLSVPGFLNVSEVGGSAGFPWYAAPYTPALPLPEALAAYGGPLPEDTVRRLGAGLAQGLAAAHAQGVTHAGLSPAAVLVTPGGPLLTCFGAARAGLAGLDPGCLAPEQASGAAAWTPAADLFALGAVLAYAATGYTVPEQSELPAGLRRLVGACLARDPADRPGSAQELLRELAVPAEATGRTGPARQAGPAAAVSPAGGTAARDPRLPATAGFDLAAHSLPAARVPAPASPPLPAAHVPGPTSPSLPAAHVPGPTSPSLPAAHVPGPASPSPPTATVLDHAAPPPLPGRVVAALASQSAALLAAELPVPQQAFAATQKVR